MNGSDLKRLVLNDVLAGVLLGLLFPVLAWQYDLHVQQLPMTLASLIEIHRRSGLHFIIDTAPFVLGSLALLLGIYRVRLEQSNRDLAAQILETNAILNTAATGIITIDRHGDVVRFNRAAEQIFGYSAEEICGRNVKLLMPDSIGNGHDKYLARHMESGESTIIDRRREETALRKNGEIFPIELHVSRIELPDQVLFTAVIQDLTERHLLESQLSQAQKLEAIGQLSAGIAHEINTPVQYIGDNLSAIGESLEDMTRLFDAYQRLGSSIDADSPLFEEVEKIRRLEEELDLPFLLEDTPDAVRQSSEGVRRVASIVRAMKGFSHMNNRQVGPADINALLNDTLTIASNEYKYTADAETDFARLPSVQCMAGELNQVFLNLIINAAHAIAARESEQRGIIRLTTRTNEDGSKVIISISDNGTGIPADVQPKIFDPFFTTKEVGVGTGQGLSISYQVITGTHAGRLWFDTETGVGTTFHIELPVQFKGEAGPVSTA